MLEEKLAGDIAVWGYRRGALEIGRGTFRGEGEEWEGVELTFEIYQPHSHEVRNKTSDRLRGEIKLNVFPKAHETTILK